MRTESNPNIQAALRHVVLILLLVALLSPSLFIIAKANHECTGDNCTICKTLEGALYLRNEGAAVPEAAAVVLFAIAYVLLLMTMLSFMIRPDTLVSLKVRIDR